MFKKPLGIFPPPPRLRTGRVKIQSVRTTKTNPVEGPRCNISCRRQARRKHFGSGAAIGTKKTAGGLGAP